MTYTVTVITPPSLSVNSGQSVAFTVGPIVQQTVNVNGGDGGADSSVYTAIAGEALGGNKVVYINAGKAYLFNPSNTSLYGRTLGITTGAALTDATVSVKMFGVMDWTGTALTPNSLYYAGANGQLTTNPSGLIVLQKAGHAIAINKLKISFDLNVITI